MPVLKGAETRLLLKTTPGHEKVGYAVHLPAYEKMYYFVPKICTSFHSSVIVFIAAVWFRLVFMLNIANIFVLFSWMSYSRGKKKKSLKKYEAIDLKTNEWLICILDFNYKEAPCKCSLGISVFAFSMQMGWFFAFKTVMYSLQFQQRMKIGLAVLAGSAAESLYHLWQVPSWMNWKFCSCLGEQSKSLFVLTHICFKTLPALCHISSWAQNI